MEPSHELFNGQYVSLILETEFECDILLVFQVQTVISSTGYFMEMITNEPDEAQLILQILEFIEGLSPYSLAVQILVWFESPQRFGVHGETIPQ